MSFANTLNMCWIWRSIYPENILLLFSVYDKTEKFIIFHHSVLDAIDMTPAWYAEQQYGRNTVFITADWSSISIQI